MAYVLPAWLGLGAVVTLPELDKWRCSNRGRLYRVIAIRESRTTASGYQVTVQPVEPPYYKQGKAICAGHCHEATLVRIRVDISGDSAVDKVDAALTDEERCRDAFDRSGS